ncbi:hypothetical protein MTO96_003086 [Rhipicephalus appendiculatus]
MPQQIALEGDDVNPAELQGNGWFSVLKRRQESREKSHAARQPGVQRGSKAKPNATLRHVAAASRLPAMLRSHNRVIVRPGGGLNVQACNPHRILAALTMAAQLAPSVTEEDIICLNSMQNIFVVSTPSATNAAAYSRVTEIILTDQRHPVTAYLSPAGITSRGVIRGVGTDFDDAALNRMLMEPRNPSLLGARRIKNTATVIQSAQLRLLRPGHLPLHVVQASNRHLPQLRPSGPPPRRVPHSFSQGMRPMRTLTNGQPTRVQPTSVCLMRRSTPHGRPRMPISLPAALPGAPPSSAPSPTKARPTANIHPRTQPGSCLDYRTPRTSPRPTNFCPPLISLPGPTRWQAKVRPAQRSVRDTCHSNLTRN